MESFAPPRSSKNPALGSGRGRNATMDSWVKRDERTSSSSSSSSSSYSSASDIPSSFYYKKEREPLPGDVGARLLANCREPIEMDRRSALRSVGAEESEDRNDSRGWKSQLICKAEASISSSPRHKEYGTKGGKFSDAVVLDVKQFEEFAVCGLPFISRAFFYSLLGRTGRGKLGGREKYYVESCRWHLSPLTRRVAEALVLEVCSESKHPRDVGAMVQRANIFRRGVVAETTLEDLKKLIEEVLEEHEWAVADWGCPSWKLASKPKTYDVLCQPPPDTEEKPLYSPQLVLALDDETADELARAVRSDPLPLFFRATTPFFWREKEGGREMKITEISPSHYDRVAKIVEDAGIAKPKPWWRYAVEMYGRVKEAAKVGKHSYATNAELSGSYSEDEIEEFFVALDWLKCNGVLCQDFDTGDASLSEVVEWEHCLALAFANVASLSRYDRDPVLRRLDDPDMNATDEGDPLSREQRRALEACSTNGIVLINGPGGSGKTKTIAALAKLYTKRESIAVSLQGVNAGVGLHRIFGHQAQTTHQLLYRHCRECPKMPWNVAARRRAGSTDESPKPWDACFLEGVRFAVVDEFEMETLDVTSKFLSALCLCAWKTLELLVLVGDVNQLQPIQLGRCMKDVRELFAELDGRGGCKLMDFVECHRAEYKVVANNCRAVAEGVPEGIRYDDRFFVHVPVEAGEKVEQAVVRAIDKFGLSEREHHVLVRTNEARRAVAPAVEQYYRSRDPRWKGKSPRGGGIHLGRKMQVKDNNRELGLYNGTIATIKHIEDLENSEVDEDFAKVGIRMQKASSYTSVMSTGEYKQRSSTRQVHCVPLEGTETVVVEVDKWFRDNCVPGSAGTVHSFLGSGIGTVVFVADYFSDYFHREILYTAISRAKRGVLIVGSKEVVARAVGNPEPERRSSLGVRMRAEMKVVAERLAASLFKRRRDHEI